MSTKYQQMGVTEGTPAINGGYVLGRHDKESYLTSVPPLQGDGQRGANDYLKSQLMSDSANIARGIDTQNAQEDLRRFSMNSDIRARQAGEKAAEANTMASRQTSQIGLASGIQQAILKHRQAMLDGLTGQA